MMTGFIKFICSKGYGFITADDGEDYFFHISQCRSEEASLVCGARVTFSLSKYMRNGEPKVDARNVTVI